MFIFRAFTCEAHQETYQNLYVKVYVDFNDLIFNSEGIFLIEDEDIRPLRSIYVDTGGFYLTENRVEKKISTKSHEAKRGKSQITDECYNKHKIWCWNCLGCAHPYCRFRDLDANVSSGLLRRTNEVFFCCIVFFI